MAINANKFRNIVGGITTPLEPAVPEPPVEAIKTPVLPETPEQIMPPVPEQGRAGEAASAESAKTDARPAAPEGKRFAKLGRPKGRKTDPSAKINKVKVSLFLDETLVNELYDWAHQDRMHPGELFDKVLRNYRDREAKRRNGGME